MASIPRISRQQYEHSLDNHPEDWIQFNYLTPDVGERAKRLDPVTRAVHPFIVPCGDGPYVDYRGMMGSHDARALGLRKGAKSRYEKLQWQHMLDSEVRFNGSNTKLAEMLRHRIANYN